MIESATEACKPTERYSQTPLIWVEEGHKLCWWVPHLMIGGIRLAHELHLDS